MIGVLYSVGAGASFGFIYPISKIILDRVNVETANTVWYFFTAMMYLAYFALKRDPTPVRAVFERSRSIAALSLLLTAAFYLTSLGVIWVGPVNTSFLLQFMNVFAVVFGLLFLGERFTKLEGAGVIAAILGGFVISLTGRLGLSLENLVVIAAAFLIALSSYIAKNLVRTIHFTSVAAGRSIFVLLFFLVLTLGIGKMEWVAVELIPIFLLGAFVGDFVGPIFMYKAFSLLEISKAMPAIACESYFSVIFSFLFLSLVPGLNQLLGGFLIIVGVFLLTRKF